MIQGAFVVVVALDFMTARRMAGRVGASEVQALTDLPDVAQPHAAGLAIALAKLLRKATTMNRTLLVVVLVLLIAAGLWLLWAFAMGGFCAAPANAACA